MCNNNCYLNTPTSQTERQQQGSCVRVVEGEEQARQLSPLAEMETPCCGCATEQAVGSQGVVAVDDPWEWEVELKSLRAGEQWDEPTSVDRRSFLQIWWHYLKGNTT